MILAGQAFIVIFTSFIIFINMYFIFRLFEFSVFVLVLVSLVGDSRIPTFDHDIPFKWSCKYFTCTIIISVCIFDNWIYFSISREDLRRFHLFNSHLSTCSVIASSLC